MIRITVAKGGKVSALAEGIKGGRCEALIEQITGKLEGQVTKREHTAEFYEQEQDQTRSAGA